MKKKYDFKKVRQERRKAFAAWRYRFGRKISGESFEVMSMIESAKEHNGKYIRLEICEHVHEKLYSDNLIIVDAMSGKKNEITIKGDIKFKITPAICIKYKEKV